MLLLHHAYHIVILADMPHKIYKVFFFCCHHSLIPVISCESGCLNLYFSAFRCVGVYVVENKIHDFTTVNKWDSSGP